MSDATLNLLVEIIHESALVLAFIGSFIAILLGILLITSPAIYFKIATKLNTWVSTRRSLKAMEVPHYQERHVYRRHRLFGTVITACALYTLYYFSIEFQAKRIEHLLYRLLDNASPHLVSWLVESGSLLLVILNLFALVLGIIVLIRPSLLKGLESASNRWISTRNATRPLNHEFHVLDSLTNRKPRLMGTLLIGAGLYVLIMFSIFLI